MEVEGIVGIDIGTSIMATRTKIHIDDLEESKCIHF